jgi:di/tricarboxylate transporter
MRGRTSGPAGRIGYVPGELTTDQAVYLVILIASFALLLTEKLRNDIVAILIIVSLYMTGVLSAEQAVAGFSSEPALVVAGIFVLSKGMHQTGLSEMIGLWVGRLAGATYTRMTVVIMSSVAVLSAFTHHLTTTAVMLPVTLNLSRERGISPSKTLMPLSFAASLGTTITIIGAPAFLLASDALKRAGRPGLGVFSIAPIGIALSVVGTAFIVLAGRFLLPDRGQGERGEDRFQLEEYLTEVAVLPGSPYEGRTMREVQSDNRHDLDIEALMRDGRRLPDPGDNYRLQVGDVLLARASAQEIASVRQDGRVELAAVARYQSQIPGEVLKPEEPTEQLVQAVVAPMASLLGQTIGQARFRQRFGAVVVSLSRRGERLRSELNRTPLQAGDVLVIQGDEDALERVSADRDFLMLVPFEAESRARWKAPLAGLIMLATIAGAASNLMTIEMAAISGAITMVLTRCLTPREAYRGIDQRIFVFIAGAIPLGAAMEKTGTSELIAGWLQDIAAGRHEFLVLLVVFAIVGVLTQFMSDAATTAIFAPVAIALAAGLDHPPEAYVVTVAMASVASFLTPIGHHGNLLVYGPGRYQFADFVRVGAPLTVLVAIIVALMAPMLW